MTKRILSILLFAGLFISLSACYSIPSDMTAVEVEGSPTKAKKVLDCKPPATRSLWSNNDYNMFPISEREWDATGQKGSDAGRFKAFTKDSVEMYVPVTVRFTLITECDTLKDFYVKYARRYQVEFSDDGSYNAAWITVLRKLIADPADQTLDRIIQDYNWREVWNDPKIKPEIEKRLDEALSSKDSLLVQTAHKAYFENISVLVGKARPVEKALSDAVALEQTNVAKAQSAQAQAKAEEAKAIAQLATQRAEANKTKADIGAFPTVESYNINLCIRTSGCNPFPSPIIPGIGAR